MYHLGRRIREQLARLDASRGTARARPHVGLPDARAARGARRRGGAARDQRLRRRTASALAATRSCGPTARPRCGCWIYCGCFADGVNQTARRKPGAGADLGRARVGVGVAAEPAHPLQPRLRRSRRAAVVGAQALRVVGRGRTGRWTGEDVPDFKADMPPDYVPPRGRHGRGRAARRRAVRHAGRRPRAGCSRRTGSSTARCRPTTSRTSRRSRTRSTGSSANPARQRFTRARQPVQPDRRRAGRRRVPVRGHHLPADRAPHRRRHVAHAALPRRAAARDVLRGRARSWPPSAGSSTAAGRRS